MTTGMSFSILTEQQQVLYQMIALSRGIKAGRCAESCEFKITGVPDDDAAKLLVILSHRQAGNELADGRVALGTFDRRQVVSPDIIAAIEREVPKLTERHEVVL